MLRSREPRRELRLSVIRARLRGVYYGWPMLVAVAVAQVVSWGVLYYAFTVFIAPMQAELGWSAVTLTGGYSLALLCSGLAAVPVGWWIDRHGPRALMTVGSILAGLLVLAWANVQSVAGFYAIMAGIGLVSAAVLYELAFAIVATWFRRQRGRALALLTFFGAFASFIFVPLSNGLVSALGWRTALLALAGLLAAVTVPLHALALRRRPADLGLEPDGGVAPGERGIDSAPEPSIAPQQALREPRFWLISAAFATSAFATVTMTVHLIPYLRSVGHSAAFAATVAGLFGLMSLAGRLTIGPWMQRVPGKRLGAALTGAQLLGVLALLTAGQSAVSSLAYIVVFGAGAGTLTILRAALLAERYGPAHYGTINGAQNVLLTAARALAPVSAAWLVGAFGGYGALLWVLVVLLGCGVLALLVEWG